VAVAHKGDRPGAASRAQRREERHAAGGSSSTGAGPGAGNAAGASGLLGSVEIASDQAEAFARKGKKGSGGGQKGSGGGQKGSGGGQKGKKEHKGKGKKTGDPPPEEEGSEGSGQEGASDEGSNGSQAKGKTDAPTASVAAAGAASFAQAAPVPEGGTGSASISSALPAAKAGLASGLGARHAKRPARAHRRRRPDSLAEGVAATGAVSVLSSLTSASSPAAGATVHSAGPRAKRTHASQSQPALVRTFTKIVGVVPTPVRILIGGLILLALLLGGRSLMSGVRARRLERQRRQLLADVGLLQAALLPEPPARLGPVATSAAYRPADGPGAGGDFYDVFALEGGEIAVVVGDVSGHGREALPHTALLRFTVRAYLEAGLSPREALQTAGGVLERQLAGSFATVIAATYNPRRRRLTYASAGHPPPVVLGEGEQRALASVTSCSAPPIGAGMRTGIRQTVLAVPGPARLCFHTDGVTEARIGGELFGAERLAEELRELPRDAGAAALLERVAERSDARPDDMAACLLRVHDGQGAPAIALEQLELDRELLAGTRVERFLFDWGVSAVQARALLREARERLRHADTVLLELVPSEDGRASARLVEQNLIRTAAFATAGA